MAASDIDVLHVCTVPVTIKLFMKGQLSFMKNKGFSVAAAASGGPELIEVGELNQVGVYPVPFTRAPSLFRDLMSVVSLFRLFFKVKPTIVHSSTSKAGPFAMMAALLCRVPVRIYTLRGILIDRRGGPLKRVLKAIEWLGCRCAHQVIAVSPSVAEVVVTERLCPSHKVKVLGNGSSNGVDAQGLFNPERVTEEHRSALKKRLGIAPTEKVIGFIGRLVEGKGIADLVSAWRIISCKLQDVRLLIIGTPEDQAPVDQRILDELYSDTRVIMIDSVDQQHLPVYYGIMNALAFPTLSEGFPNVVLESAAMEVPVVASRVTGCVDAISHDSTGMLVPVGDARALADGIVTYLNDPVLSARHGQAARERVVSKFQPEIVWEALYEEYIRMLKERGIKLPIASHSRDNRTSGQNLTAA